MEEIIEKSKDRVKQYNDEDLDIEHWSEGNQDPSPQNSQILLLIIYHINRTPKCLI